MITEVPMGPLQTGHKELETLLEQELSRPLPDPALIAGLKK
jgi:hypothetical protein